MALEKAFISVWETLYVHVPVNGEDATVLKARLGRTVIGLVAEGITDPKDLRRKALVTMALNPR